MKNNLRSIALGVALTAAAFQPAFAGGTEMESNTDFASLSLEELLDLSASEMESMLRGSGSIDLCLREGTPSTYLQYWDLFVDDAIPGTWFLAGELYADFLATPWSVIGTYHIPSGTISLDATNPAPDFCTVYSDFFNNTGTRSGASFSGTWTNNCGGSGTWVGNGKRGDCPAVAGARYGSEMTAGGGAVQRNAAIRTTPAVYPNPARELLVVELAAYEGQEVQVQAYDASGRLIATLYNGTATAPLSWDVSAQPEGMYLIRIANTTSQLAAHPVLVAR